MDRHLNGSNYKYRVRDHIIDLSVDFVCRIAFILSINKRKVLSNNKTYYNKFKNQRCFILGNGPSLNNFDTSILNEEIVYCVNEFYRSDKLQLISPNYYFLADPAYFSLETNDSEDVRFVTSIKNLLEQGVELWVPLDFSNSVKKYNWESSGKIHYFLNNLSDLHNYSNKILFDRCIPNMQAVIQYAILHAVYAGFSEIYLVGVEQTDIFSSLSTYLHANTEYNYSFSLNDKEKKWISGHILQYPLYDLLYGYSRIFRLYDELFDYCNKNAVKIYNCSGETLIKSIPSIDFKELKH